jgi:hypothetical protein
MFAVVGVSGRLAMATAPRNGVAEEPICVLATPGETTIELHRTDSARDSDGLARRAAGFGSQAASIGRLGARQLLPGG